MVFWRAALKVKPVFTLENGVAIVLDVVIADLFISAGSAVGPRFLVLIGSGTGGRISAKLANEGAGYNRVRAFSSRDLSLCDLVGVVNGRVIAKLLAQNDPALTT